MGKVFAAVVILITVVSAGIFIAHTWWLPVDISSSGPAIDRQLNQTMVGTGILFFVSQIMLAMFVWGASNSSSSRKIKLFPGGATPLVALGVIVVGIEILALTFVGSRAWGAIYIAPPEPNALRIDVQAQQFAFYFRYPGPDGVFGGIHPEKMDDGSGNYFGLDPVNDSPARDDIVAASLRIPVNTPIWLTLHSKDVGHSFFVRELRIQQDFVPGLDIPVHFTATKIGKYEIVCTQLCGLGHYNMKAYLFVLSADDFDRWLKTQASQ